MYDHRLASKGEMVRTMEENVCGNIDQIEHRQKQFYIGVKTYMKKNL